MNKNIFDALSIKKESNIKQVNDDKEAKNQEFLTADGITIVEKAKKEKTISKNVVDEPSSSPIKINLGDFPALSTAPLTKEQRRNIDETNLKYNLKSTAESPLSSEKVDERTSAFNHMADKEKVAKSLTCTKACRNVARDKETGEFGVCLRKVCTFAHSNAELQPPWCSFDRTCRFKHGRTDRKTRKRIPGSQCKFIHGDETVEEYYKRSGTKRPDLPPTSEKTRKIPEDKNAPKQTKKCAEIPPPKPSPKPTANPTPSLSNAATRKSRLDEKPVRKRRPYDSEDDYSSSDSESSFSESSSSSESDSESDEEYRRGRRRERSRRRYRSPKKSPSQQIIRVPTKELAAIAIKAAFDRGQYNIRVLVE